MTTWTFHWSVKWGQGPSYRTEPSTYGIWSYLQVDSIKIELNCKIPHQCQRIAWWCGGKAHILELVLESLGGNSSIATNSRLTALCFVVPWCPAHTLVNWRLVNECLLTRGCSLFLLHPDWYSEWLCTLWSSNNTPSSPHVLYPWMQISGDLQLVWPMGTTLRRAKQGRKQDGLFIPLPGLDLAVVFLSLRPQLLPGSSSPRAHVLPGPLLCPSNSMNGYTSPLWLILGYLTITYWFP